MSWNDYADGEGVRHVQFQRGKNKPLNMTSSNSAVGEILGSGSSPLKISNRYDEDSQEGWTQSASSVTSSSAMNIAIDKLVIPEIISKANQKKALKRSTFECQKPQKLQSSSSMELFSQKFQPKTTGSSFPFHLNRCAPQGSQKCDSSEEATGSKIISDAVKICDGPVEDSEKFTESPPTTYDSLCKNLLLAPKSENLRVEEADSFSFEERNPQMLPKSLKKSRKKKDILASKLPPKDSRVCIISSSQREKFLQSDFCNSSVYKENSPLKEEDFPHLSLSFTLQSKSCASQDIYKISDAESNSLESNDPSNTRTNKSKSWDKLKKRRPHMKEPITVNILDIIKKTSEMRHKNMSTVGAYRKNVRCDERLGGNMLDSSNPIRKRGKHREVPAKKRLSKLKLIILSERQKKQDQRLGKLNEENVANISPREEQPVESICDCLSSLCIDGCSSINIGEDTLSIQLERQKGERINCSESGSSSNNGTERPSIQFEMKDVEEKIPSSEPVASPQGVSADNLLALHSRKFRDYCDNFKCSDLDSVTTNLLKEIYRFQDRYHQKEPALALAKRRFVLGFREVKKYLMLRKLKAIVVAPDLEPIKGPGGLDETIKQIREEGKFQRIPVVFAVGRRQLGFALKKKVPISAIGIINPEGAEELFQCMLEQWKAASQKYQQAVEELSNSSH